MDTFLKRHRFDLLLGLSIICLALLLAGKRLSDTQMPPVDTPPIDELFGLNDGRYATEGPISPISFSNHESSESSWNDGQSSEILRCKIAVRMIETRDAFIVTMSARNIDTNTVRISLNGSLLTILLSHTHPDRAFEEIKNSIMLPTAVDPTVQPTFWLTNDLLQVQVSKPQAFN